MENILPIQRLKNLRLSSRVTELLAQELADNTKAAYLSDWCHLVEWCKQENYPVEPVQVDGLCEYLADHEEAFKVSTLRRRVYAIKKVHEMMGWEDPTDDKLVLRLLKGMARRKGTLKTQAKPADKADLEEVVLSLPDTNAGLRDRVLLLLGFRGAFRRSELAGLDIEDLNFVEAGITIRLRHSKTDKEGKGLYKAISEKKRNLPLCPVYNTNRYLEALGRNTGPLFVGTTRGGNFLSKRISSMSIHRILKKHLGNEYSPHSLRSGFVTAARKLEIPDYQIQNQTHHKDIRTLGEYYRPDSIWEDNAESKL